MKKNEEPQLTDKLMFNTVQANGRDFRKRHTKDIRPENGGSETKGEGMDLSEEIGSDIALKTVRSHTLILIKGQEAKEGEYRPLTLGLQVRP